MPVPGANVFISREDVTTPVNEAGYRTITCQAITDTHAGYLAAKGVNLLRRILALSG